MNLKNWRFWRKPEQAAILPVEQPKHAPRRKGWGDVHIPAQSTPYQSPFKVAQAAPGVIPKGATTTMAMDSHYGTGSNDSRTLYGWSDAMYSSFEEGQQFLGYATLAALLQRSEYRVPCETLASEMTRNWGNVTYTGDDDASSTEKKAAGEKKKQLEDEFKRLGVQNLVRLMIEQGEMFGRAQIYIDTGASENPQELKMPLVFESTKIRKGGLKGLQIVEAMWTYPGIYNATNPLRDDYYKPQTWYVLGKEVHHTRMLTLIPHPVSQILKPAYAFGGLSLVQMMKPYVDNWLTTRQSVNDIIGNFSTSVLKTNLQTLIQDNTLLNRLQAFVTTRSNQGVFAVDMDSEDFSVAQTNLGSLDKLQAQAQEHMAAPARIPLVKLFGITPSGLNASSEEELQVFYESLSSDQEAHATPIVDAILKLAQLNIWGEIDPNIGWKWNPIKHLDAVETATADKMKAETDSIRINDGIIDPSEVRTVLANDEESPYHGIDPNDVPEPPEDLIGPGEGSFAQQEKE